jgi:hypothetical protein
VVALLAVPVVIVAVGAASALAPDPAPPAGDAAAPQGPALGRFERELQVEAFHRGNLHTHSLESDGDVPPEDVYRWYRSHDYQFVALTDHNRRVDPSVYRHLERPGFKILAGEEVTMLGGGRQVHVNALCTQSAIRGGTFGTRAEALRYAIDKIDAQRGIALINHPNFDRSLGADDLWEGRSAALLEIMSGHPYVYSNGVDARPSHEALWAELLTRGADLHGVAVDDAHHYADDKSLEKTARPGRAWIATFAAPGADVRADATCEAIRGGSFYASNGPRLARLEVSDRTLTVWPTDKAATVVFLGPGDRVLATEQSSANGATYALSGDERWVRARIERADGSKAWTQPMRVVSR